MSKEPCIKYLSHIFPGVYVGFTSSVKKFKKECKRMGVKGKHHQDRIGRTWCFENGNKITVIFVFHKKWINEDTHKHGIHGLFVHEAIHIWQYIIEHIGEERPGQELEAYHIQNIWHQLVDAYDEGE